MSELYEVSQAILDRGGMLFVKVQPHAPDDPESCDLLWFSVSEDPEDSCEGEVILLSRLAEGSSEWHAAHDHADRYGGWPTVWDTYGALKDVRDAVLWYVTECLASQSES